MPYNTTIFFIIEEVTETIQYFSQGPVKVWCTHSSSVFGVNIMIQYHSINVKLPNLQLNILKSETKKS